MRAEDHFYIQAPTHKFDWFIQLNKPHSWYPYLVPKKPPWNFDVYEKIYSSYVCYGAKVTIRFISTNNDSTNIILTSQKDLSTWENAQFFAQAGQRVYLPEAQANTVNSYPITRKISNYYSVRAEYGKRLGSENDFECTNSSGWGGPNKPCYLRIHNRGTSTATTNYEAEVYITFYVKFMKRLEPGEVPEDPPSYWDGVGVTSDNADPPP